MAETLAELQARLDELLVRQQTTAGIAGTSFSDQSTQFDAKGLAAAIATLRQQIAVASGGSSTRYAATSKGV